MDPQNKQAELCIYSEESSSSDILYLLFYLHIFSLLSSFQENGAKWQNSEKILIIDLCLLYVKYFTYKTYFQDSPSSFIVSLPLNTWETKAYFSILNH